MVCAIATSVAAHTLLLLASPGKLDYGFGGDNQLAGESSSGKLLVRLAVPTAKEKTPIFLPPGSALDAAPAIPTPKVNTPAPATTPPQTSRVTEEVAALEFKRGEPDITTSPPLVNENTKLGLPILPPQRYYAAADLDVRPQIKVPPVFNFPELAVANGTAGKVVVDILLSEDGQIEEVVVVHAEPAGVFEESVIAGWRAAQFTPGIKTNANVKSRVSLEINFEASRADMSHQGLRPQY